MGGWNAISKLVSFIFAPYIHDDVRRLGLPLTGGCNVINADIISLVIVLIIIAYGYYYCIEAVDRMLSEICDAVLICIEIRLRYVHEIEFYRIACLRDIGAHRRLVMNSIKFLFRIPFEILMHLMMHLISQIVCPGKKTIMIFFSKYFQE